jgi:hypothetical protein
VGDLVASTYERLVLTAAARPHVFWVGEDQERVRGWPIGRALLEALGEINRDVQEALADERARLSKHGYSEDLPLPALWWVPAPRAENEPADQLLPAVPA